MSEPRDHDVRAGIQQAKLGEFGLKVLTAEAVVIAGIAGGRTSSWGVGILTFLAVAILANLAARYQRADQIVAFILGLAWGGLAYFLAHAYQATDLTAIAATALAMGVGYGGNIAALQHLRDIQRSKG